MVRWWVGLWIAGCAGVGGPVPVVGGAPGPAGGELRCPDGATATSFAPGEGEHRLLDDTEVRTCVDAGGRPSGPHVERWSEGRIAVEGAWKDGLRDGAWTRWHPDGAFHSQVTWEAGRQHGERLEVGKDGRVVRIRMEGGAASELAALDAGAPMPEWEGGERIQGTRYQAHAGATP